MTKTFPEGFLWGAASSATQMEGAADKGGKAQNVWDYWFEQEPERFHQQIGPAETSDFYHRYEEDIANMASIHMNSFRTSISWARLMPDGKNVNEEAIVFYKNMLQKMKENHIEPIINLYHFDMPMHFQEIGGWENKEVVQAFIHFATTAFTLFDEDVARWTTFNEPIVPVEMGYLNDFHYPCVRDMKRAVQVAYNTMIASAGAVKAYKAGNYAGEIGIILNLMPSYPKSDDPKDIEAAEIADLLFNRSFLDPSVLGVYPEKLIQLLKEHQLLPDYEQAELDMIQANTVDFLGVNYYQPRRVQAKQQPSGVIDPATVMPEDFFDAYVWPERKMNPHRGWEIYEKGIYDIAVTIKDNYGNIPWYIAENGMGVENEERFLDEEGMIQDDYRIEFIEEHLKWLHKGIEEGSNCFGYHLWTFTDNWSWLNSYKNRYGFFRLDLATQQRTVKKSGLWFKQVVDQNGLSE